MKKKYFHFYAAINFIFIGLIAQNSAPVITKVKKHLSWQEMKMNGANFYDIQKKFHRHNPRVNQPEAGEREEEENGGWELFKKWEYWVAPRVYPSGDLSLLGRTHDEYRNYLNSQNTNSNQRNSNSNSVQSTNTWTYLGPASEPSGGGVGRGNCICVDPANVNNIWLGTPDGGLWKSTNSGTSWSLINDFFTDLGVSDIAIDPTNSNIIYVATGDKDGAYSGPSLHAPAYGLMKSTDGGVTWNNMYSLAVSSQYMMSRVLIDPSNTQNIYVSGNFGIIKSTNGGTSWTTIFSTEVIMSMEFKPGTSSTLYAVGTSFHLSTNSGTSWTTITSGLPTSSAVTRLSIGVSAANASYCYVLAADASNYGLYGVYLSTNAGTGMTFTQQHGATSPNLLGFNQNGSDNATGQGFYTLSIGVNPTNVSEVMVGGVNIWKSTNAGVAWGSNSVTYWAAAHTSSTYVHADIHHILYVNGTTVLTACDGGIFKTTNNGTAWTDLSNNLQIAQMYGLGMSTTNVNKILSGWQDNGTNIMTAPSTWSESLFGDGMKCFIDYSNDNTMYGEQYQGSFNISTNSGASWTTLPKPSTTENTAWATPWKQDPSVANTIYGGMTNLYKSTNQGSSWTVMGTMPDASNYINEFAIAPSNSQIVYVVKNSGVYKTTNGGTTWTNVTGTIPASSAAPTYVAICPTNPNIAYVTLSGFSSGNKVFVTADGGTTWTNYSTGLPNIAANCITYQKNAHGAVYVGMDVGVYYRDSTSGTWVAYNTGLPNVIVTQMEIFYSTGVIRASTYGRGIWQIPVNTVGSQAPIASFSATPTNVCPGSSVQFTDMSAYSPTSWSWTFQGGTPATSTTQNPSVTYTAAGTYSVSLTATNANGSSTYSVTNYITVSGPQALPLVEGFEGTTFPPTNWGENPAPFDWHQNTTVGRASSKSAWFDNYDTNSVGTKSYLTTPKYNFSGLSSAKLFFDVAYAAWDHSYSDTLAVYISTNCGLSWTQLYIKGGTTLSTTGAYDSTAIFVPTAAQWRTDTIHLNSYVGNASVMIKFENRPAYGQALYLDNVNISGVTSVAPVASYSVASSTICAGSSINFINTSTGSPTSYTWTFAGGNPSTSNATNPTVTYTAAGTYTLSLIASNSSGTNTATGTVVVNVIPTITVSTNPATICSGSTSTLSANGAATYTWSANAGSATTNTVSVSPASNTTYTVTGSTGTCSSSKTVSINVNATPTVTAAASPINICIGVSSVLTAGGATTYTWSANAGSAITSTVSVSPTSNTTYTVTGASGTCISTQTVVVSVTPNPTIMANAAPSSICSGQNTTLSATGATSYTWSSNAGNATTSTVSVSPTSNTTYTVTGASGICTSTQTVTVSIMPTPTITSNASPSFICSGQNTTLSATGATTYTWDANAGGATTNTVSVSPATNIIYTVTGTTGLCSSSQTVSVNVTNTPTIIANSSPTTICTGSNAVLTASGATTYTWDANAGSVTTNTVSVSPSSNIIYTVTGANGICTSTQTVSVNVASSVTVTATVSSPTICSGNADTLTASGASSYTWSANAGSSTTSTVSVSPSSNSVYTVTGSSGTCASSNTVSIAVITTPATPTITFASGVLTSSSATGNQWYLNGVAIGSATSQTYTPAMDGNYTDIITTSGCASAVSNTVAVFGTGIAGVSQQNSIDIYPNPNDGNFTVSITNHGIYKIEILNPLSQIIYTEVINNPSGGYYKQLNLSEKAKGIYYITISNDNTILVKKIVIQ